MPLSHTFLDPFTRAAVFVLFRFLAVLKQEPLVMCPTSGGRTWSTLPGRLWSALAHLFKLSRGMLAGEVACREVAHTSKQHQNALAFE